MNLPTFAKFLALFDVVRAQRSGATGGVEIAGVTKDKTAAELAGSPTAADIALGDSTVFYDRSDPTRRYAMDIAHTEFVSLSGPGGGGSGADGLSAYQLAVSAGFLGTLAQWLASLVGEPGQAGNDGDDGLSAYQLAVNAGFAGTQAEWLASLVGEPGQAGNDGDDGLSAYQLAVIAGFAGTQAEWLASLVGEPGPAGNDGDDGLSAYQLAVNAGFAGTQAEWLTSLVGEPGPAGNDGDDGLSAYQLAVNAGFAGTQAQWLATLVGPAGAPIDTAAPHTWDAQQTFVETKYTTYNLAGTVIDPANGDIQYKTLTANTTLTEAIEDGQAVVLMIDDGASFTVIFPTMTWIINAPVLHTTGYTVIVLWKIGATLFGIWR